MYLENLSSLELRKVGNFVSESSFWKFYIRVWPSAAQGWNHLKVTSGVNFNQSRLRADPGWLYLQCRYKVCSSPRHPPWGEGGWHGDEGHDEVEESWIAGAQSIIAPVGLYWLCSPTGLPRSMCSQAFCVGRWRSVPGLTLTFYSDACVRVSVIY